MSKSQLKGFFEVIVIITLVLLALATTGCTSNKPVGYSEPVQVPVVRKEFDSFDKTPEEIEQILKFYENYDPNKPLQPQSWMTIEKIKEYEKKNRKGEDKN